jgi:UPF0755 protein
MQAKTTGNIHPSTDRKNRMRKRLLWLAIIMVLVAGITAAGTGWVLIYGDNTQAEAGDPYHVYVSPEMLWVEVEDKLIHSGLIRRPRSFRLLATHTGTAGLLKPGRYLIREGMSNYQLLQMFRNGLQDPLRFTFNNINFVEDFAGVAGRNFMFDSLAILHVLRNHLFLDSLGVKPEMLLGHLLPNTYEMYWTTSPERLIVRLVNESERFWSGQRKELLAKRNLKRDDVLILASIIQKETNHPEEMARMAGVYMNRLKLGMKLQADPTVKFAIGDLSIRRVLYRHLEYPSPYNTYYTYGLPPGVICAPNPVTIDRVLNYEDHDYLFFCAKPGYNSTHAFAKTNRQHEQNRQRYIAWLRSEGIR